MAKNKETVPEILDEEIREEEQPSVKGPLRDDPEPAYTPAWQVVNRRQDIYSDKIPPKIYSLEALMAAGIMTEETLADAGYVKNTDYATSGAGGVFKTSPNAYCTTVTNGYLQGSIKDSETFYSGAVYPAAFVTKGTLNNITPSVASDGLVKIAGAQFAEPTAGTYTVKLTYDGTAWGVTIIQDT